MLEAGRPRNNGDKKNEKAQMFQTTEKYAKLAI